MSVTPSNNVVVSMRYMKELWGHKFWQANRPVDPETELNLTGQIVIVTGSNSGIGKEAARELAGRGAEVIMACRNISKAEEAAEDIRKSLPNAKLVIMELDVADLKSIIQFSEKFKNRYDKLDLLVNNAGYMNTDNELVKTKDGFEQHMGVNHLGPFLLTRLLLDILKATKNSRIISVSSTEILLAKLDLDDLMMDKGLKRGNMGMAPYDISKLANALCMRRLAKIELENTDVKVFQLCPGLVDTPMLSKSGGFYGWIRKVAAKFAAITPQQGCETIIYCAVSKELYSSSDTV